MTTQAASPPVVARRTRPDLRGLLVTAGAATVPAVALAGGYLTLHSGSKLPLLAVVGAAVAAVMVWWPRLACLAVLVFWAGAFNPEWLASVTPRGRADLSGIAVLALGGAGVLLRTVVRLPGSRRVRVPAGRFRWPVLACMSSLVFGAVVAKRAGSSTTELVYAYLGVLAFLSYFLFRHVYHGRPNTLALDMVVTTGVCGAVACAASIAHFTPLAGNEINYVITGSSVAQATRLSAPVLRMLSLTILMAGVGDVLRRGAWRRTWLLVVAAMMLTEAMSLTRSTWVPLILMAVVLPVAWSRAPLRTLLVRGVAAALIGIAAVSVASTGALGEQGKTIATRLLSTTDKETTKEDSLILREQEDAAASRAIHEHPLTGIGFFRPYGVFWPTYDRDLNLNTYTPQQFIHETYLGVWIWAGLPGVLSVLYLFLATVRSGWQVWTTRVGDRSTPLAALAGLLCLAISSTFQTNIVYAPAYTAAGVGLAYLDVWLTARRTGQDLLPAPHRSA